MTPHDQIRTVLAAYCHSCDDGDLDAFAALFTEDATFTVMGTTHRGRSAIRAFMEVAQPPERRGKHLISEPAIELAADQRVARCRTDYAFVGRTGEPAILAITSTGRYVDVLHHEPDGQWRIARRQIVFLGDPEPAEPEPGD